MAHDEEANPAWKFSVTDADGNLMHHGHIQRRPNATEKAFVKARDKKCRAPGCRQPANVCDDDHRQEWANHGPSHRGNIDTACRHHHRLRHERGFRVRPQPGGGYIWEAPNGLLYPVPPDATLHLSTEDEPIPPSIWITGTPHPPTNGRFWIGEGATYKRHRRGSEVH